MTEPKKRTPWSWLLALALVAIAVWAAFRWTDLTAGFRQGYESQTAPKP